MSIEKVLYRAHAHVTGGRDGRATVPESNLDLRLTTPKELGGGGGDGTNPEQLFARAIARASLARSSSLPHATRLRCPKTLPSTAAWALDKSRTASASKSN